MRRRETCTFLDYFNETAMNWRLGLQNGEVARSTTFLKAALLRGERLVNTLLP